MGSSPLDASDNPAGVWQVLVAATRDFARDNGLGHAWLGLSGGMDSALVLPITVEALGADAVTAVSLPSRYSSHLSAELAAEQTQALGVRLETISIEAPFCGFLDALEPQFAGQEPDLTEENLQARCRGTLLMALSNKFGGFVLATGNKSEAAVGYCTLYGDTCGAWAPIADVYKTDVYHLANWRNAQETGSRKVIPQGIIERPPSAELRPNQADRDSLPPYEELDAILRRVVDGGQSAAEIVAAGHDRATVEQVLNLYHGSAFKRAQAAPGPKLQA